MVIEQFKAEYLEELQGEFSVSLEESSVHEQYLALGKWLRKYYSTDWKNTNAKYKKEDRKQVYYFSIEFLPGRMLSNNLLNLGILDEVKQGISELGLDFDEIALAEAEPALGNGGLGRLASCFLDSMAATQIAGHGNGIRYRYGLFKQKFEDGYQIEMPDDWLREENIWEVRKRDRAVIVRFGGYLNHTAGKDGHLEVEYVNTQNVLAVPYDTAQVGFDNKTINNLRLWSAEIPEDEADKYRSYEASQAIHQITRTLYPDDSNLEGQELRLKQEYFFSSAGVQSIVRTYKKLGIDMREFADHVAIHINDTHPALVVPELMRILMDEEYLTWEEAWDVTTKTCSYTNHTILQEAMEKWPENMVKCMMPRIYEVIYEINRRHVEQVSLSHGEAIAYRTAVIEHGLIHMAHLSILASHSVNGVAQLHTEILENETLHDFYVLDPRKFNNKTNGITPRRWIYLANQELTQLIDKSIGTDWKKHPEQLEKLQQFVGNKKFLDELDSVKQDNKKRFGEYVKSTYDIDIPEGAIIDVQIKRLHAYKRQLLNVFHIIDRYLRIKENPTVLLQPRVFVFGAKAAPSYYYAKDIIKLINEVARLVNNDPDVGDQMKVVFVENYCVSLAEIIIPAADVSEQISTAGKEASGTSNMKLMANGALTIATMDGANVEIHESVGDDNIFIFGLRAHEVKAHYQKADYCPTCIYDVNDRIKRILDALVDGTIPNLGDSGAHIYDSMLKYNDEYFVLADLQDYMDKQQLVDEKYQDKYAWLDSALINISKSGRFSSDNTIKRYADEIWDVPYDK